jgi:hypothetical protein
MDDDSDKIAKQVPQQSQSDSYSTASTKAGAASQQNTPSVMTVMQGKHHANNVETAEEANLKLVPGAVTVKRPPGNKHGLHRTSQELQDKLDAAQGKHHANNVETAEEANLELVPGALTAPGNKHGLHRTSQELQDKLNAAQGKHTTAITSQEHVATTVAEVTQLPYHVQYAVFQHQS